MMGTEDGPDIVIAEDSTSADVRNFLAAVNTALFTDTRETGRITRIEIYEPPYVEIGGVFERFGIATVKVTAAKFRPAPGGTEEKIAERVVKMVLNEAPYPGPAGPLQSCQGLETTGSFEAHWGKVTALADAESLIAQAIASMEAALFAALNIDEVSGLVKELRLAAESMQAVQRDFAAAGSNLNGIIGDVVQRSDRTSEQMQELKQLLRDGFRLPERSA